MPDVESSPDGRSSTYRYGTNTPPSPAALVDHALRLMSGELDPYGAARNLIGRWGESDSSLRGLVPDALHDLEAREKRALSNQARGSKTARAAKGSALPKIGDVAYVAGNFGPTFFVVQKVHFDSTGKLTALTLADPNGGNAGPAVAIKRVQAVFSNILNQE